MERSSILHSWSWSIIGPTHGVLPDDVLPVLPGSGVQGSEAAPIPPAQLNVLVLGHVNTLGHLQGEVPAVALDTRPAALRPLNRICIKGRTSSSLL